MSNVTACPKPIDARTDEPIVVPHFLVATEYFHHGATV